MIALDTDVLSDIIGGHPGYRQRLAAHDPADVFVPVVAAAEVCRGWLAAVRAAESGKGRIPLALAYAEFAKSLASLTAFDLLPYTAAADARCKQWRAAKVRVGSQDLRIAAVAVDHAATLVTRNARDYAQVPGLTLAVWN